MDETNLNESTIEEISLEEIQKAVSTPSIDVNAIGEEMAAAGRR